MNEEWKEVLGGIYLVSSLGNVRRKQPGKGARIGKNLTPSVDTVGYLVVTPCVKGIRRVTRIHCLVADAFLGPRIHGMQINHKDGNKTNNIPSNLEYVTQAENMAHAGRTGLMQSGVNHWSNRRKMENQNESN